jgi:Do/DeqQ family serine protease
MKKYLVIILVSASFGMLGSFFYQKINTKAQLNFAANPDPSVSNVSYHNANIENGDFVKASSIATPTVVFIKTVSNTQGQRSNDVWDFWDFFGQRGPSYSSGSGVIISKDGYIVTNNHVIKDADKIDVILNNNKRTYSAKLVGADPNTDLALIKIDAKELQSITFGNSDNLRTGEWVLAVGNPFNLTSTVTAGIVSAKGRNINVNQNAQFPIESFIQTDAAINPGNSGGALVNLNGELIGINTAIQSQTGSYVGYGFAIPGNMVAKIVKDLIDFGDVQKGFTGMDVKDIDAATAEAKNVNNGVLINEVYEDGPAEKAGLKSDDIIIKVDNHTIESKANYEEQISYHRPGDNVKLVYLRNGNERNAEFKLIDKGANTSIAKKYTVTSTKLGADFQPITASEKSRLGINAGVKVSNIRNGALRQMNIPEGFVISKLNNKTYSVPSDLIHDLENINGRIVIEGYYADGGKATYSFFTY